MLLGVLTDISRVTAVFVGYCFFPSEYAFGYLIGGLDKRIRFRVYFNNESILEMKFC